MRKLLIICITCALVSIACYAEKVNKVLLSKTFPDRGTVVKVVAYERGIMGEYLCNVRFYLHRKLISTNPLKIPICYSTFGDIELVELGNGKWGFSYIFKSEFPQEGDFSSPHTKSTHYLFYIKKNSRYQSIVDFRIHFESIPYSNDLKLDYSSKLAIIEDFAVRYEDTNNDGTKDIVFLDPHSGKKEIFQIK